MKLRFFLLALLTLVPISQMAIAADSNEIVLAFPDEEHNSISGKVKVKDFLFEVVRTAALRAGYSAEFRLMPLARCLEETRLGRVDGAFSFFRSPERLHDFDFSNEPLDYIEQSLFVRTGYNLKIDDAFQWLRLEGIRIGVVNRTLHGEQLDRALRTVDSSHLVMARNYDHLATMLSAGRIDIALGPRKSLAGAIAGLALANKIQELKPSLEPVPAYMVFTKSHDLTPVRRHMDVVLNEIKKDGTYQTIQAKYSYEKAAPRH